MEIPVHAIGSRVKTWLLRKRIRYLTGQAWRKRHRKVYALYPESQRLLRQAIK